MNEDRDIDVAELLAGTRREFAATPADAERVRANVRLTLSSVGASDGTRPDELASRPSVGSGVVAKLSLWTLAVGVIAGAIVYQVRQPARPQPPVSSAPSVTSTLLSVPAPPLQPSSARTTQPDPVPVPVTKRHTRREESTRKYAKPDAQLDQGSVATPAPAVSLQVELAAMRRVELALREGHPARALAILEELRRDVPNGKLDEERGAAFVIARCALDSTARTALLADYTRHHPESMYLRRVETNCAVDADRAHPHAASE